MDNSIERANFEQELSALLNRYNRDTKTNTPDWILAQFISSCLAAWKDSTESRDEWFGFDPFKTKKED